MQLLFDDRDQHIGTHCAPDLGLHSVLACAQKVLDAQVLLDPFEEEFDLPAVFVQGCDGGSRQAGVVGQKDERLACGGPYKSYERVICAVKRCPVSSSGLTRAGVGGCNPCVNRFVEDPERHCAVHQQQVMEVPDVKAILKHRLEARQRGTLKKNKPAVTRRVQQDCSTQTA